MKVAGKVTGIFRILSIAMLLLLFSQNVMAKDPMSGTVLKLYRDVFFLDRKGGEWKKAVEGMYFTRGHVLKTGDSGTAILEYDKNLIRLGPNTVIHFEDLSGDNPSGGLLNTWENISTIIELTYGTMYVKLKEQTPTDLFRIVRGSAVLESSGGEFMAQIIEKEIGSDTPDAKRLIGEIKKTKKLPERYRVIEGELRTVVIDGSVNLTTVEESGSNISLPVNVNDVTVNKNMTSSIRYLYLSF